jgi:hypothetical protein
MVEYQAGLMNHIPASRGLTSSCTGEPDTLFFNKPNKKKLDEFEDWVVFCLDIDTEWAHCFECYDIHVCL